jgi:hypothetical protein
MTTITFYYHDALLYLVIGVVGFVVIKTILEILPGI